MFALPSAYPSNAPPQTQSSYVTTQNVTVMSPTTFDGNSSAIDFHTAETDVQAAPTYQTATTIDSYYDYTGNAVQGDFRYLGYTSTDDQGSFVEATYGPSGALADILPEAAGQTWTNVPTATVTTRVPQLESSVDTIAADGTYTDDITYESIPGASVNPTAVVVSNLDGSGTYSTPRNGSIRVADVMYSVSAPAGGSITATTVSPALVTRDAECRGRHARADLDDRHRERLDPGGLPR